MALHSPHGSEIPEEQFRVGSAPQQAAAHSHLKHTNLVVQAEQMLHILSGKRSKLACFLLCMQLLRSVGLDNMQYFMALQLHQQQHVEA